MCVWLGASEGQESCRRPQLGAGRLSATAISSWSKGWDRGIRKRGRGAGEQEEGQGGVMDMAGGMGCRYEHSIAAAAAGGRRATVSVSERQLEQRDGHGKQPTAGPISMPIYAPI